MARAAFGELHDGEAALSWLDGSPFDGRPQDVQILFLSRLDCEVRCLQLPPVAERELPALVRYRLRSVFPGSLEHAVVDHVAQRRAAGVAALVSIVDADVLARFRRAAPRAVLSLLCAALLRMPCCPRRGCIACEMPGYTEMLRFEDGVLVDSVLLRRSRSPQDARRVMRLMAGGLEDPPLLLAPGRHLQEAVRRLGDGQPAGARALESLEIPPGGVPPLFRLPRRLKAPRPVVVRAALAAALLLLSVGIVLRQAGLRQAELSALRAAVLGSQAAGQRTAEMVMRRSAASARVAGLVSARPVDVYQLFSDLREQLGPGVILQDFVLQGRSFQFQATGPGPLELMQRFISDPRFQSVRLLQTAPTGDGSGQQFIITGRYVP